MMLLLLLLIMMIMMLMMMMTMLSEITDCGISIKEYEIDTKYGFRIFVDYYFYKHCASFLDFLFARLGHPGIRWVCAVK